MTHNVAVRVFCGSPTVDNVPVERHGTSVCYATEHTLTDGEAYQYVRFVRGIGLLGRVIHNLGHRTFQRPVQPTLAGEQPFDADMHRSPLALELHHLPLVYRVGDIPRSTVTEVQACPPQVHGSMLLGGAR